jgi:hypothetical protein
MVKLGFDISFLGIGKEKSAYVIYFLLILVIVGGNPRRSMLDTPSIIASSYC